MQTMNYIGIDQWRRPVYQCVETKQLWKDVNCGNGIISLCDCQNDFDGEPNQPIAKTINLNFTTKYEKNPNEHTYLMLGRLMADCEYYLGFGNHCERHLWANNVIDQIAEMKKLYHSLSDLQKPEFLTYEQILDYEIKMTTVI